MQGNHEARSSLIRQGGHGARAKSPHWRSEHTLILTASRPHNWQPKAMIDVNAKAFYSLKRLPVAQNHSFWSSARHAYYCTKPSAASQSSKLCCCQAQMDSVAVVDLFLYLTGPYNSIYAQALCLSNWATPLDLYIHCCTS
ncbi:hypothetical protein VNO77_34089 [Canavalia gladiata]|uniref:Uncharacterized protein n=1 Tax=Canavalia gladiata TaxID=3824 RepID=A0AAN9KFY9_CANGL